MSAGRKVRCSRGSEASQSLPMRRIFHTSSVCPASGSVCPLLLDFWINTGGRCNVCANSPLNKVRLPRSKFSPAPLQRNDHSWCFCHGLKIRWPYRHLPNIHTLWTNSGCRVMRLKVKMCGEATFKSRFVIDEWRVQRKYSFGQSLLKIFSDTGAQN